MKRQFIEKVKKAIDDWAKQYPSVELAAIDVHPGSVPDASHVIVVASKGFESWRQLDRYKDLSQFLEKQLGYADSVKIPLIHTWTEEESYKYDCAHDDEVCTCSHTSLVPLPLSVGERLLIKKIENAVHEWAKQYPHVEIVEIEAYPHRSVPCAFDVIVVAQKGFENWRQMDRNKELHWFLHNKFADFKHIDISILRTLTEEESEKYERVYYV